ncbi:MAG: RdgB/HAM1 family non-canonical purine NTP pyrophosphatase [Pseudomonadota bacterium]
MTGVVLASGNAGKLDELRRLLGPAGFELKLQSEFGIDGVDETGATFVENALLKARHAAVASGCPAIADDSGLEVPALNGAPGIHSARYAGRHGDDAANNRRLLEALGGFHGGDRDAHFRCVLVYLRHAADPAPVVAEGVWRGRILTEPRGSGGFGYDPLFLDPETGKTGAELSPERKNVLSHRGQALRALLAALADQSVV